MSKGRIENPFLSIKPSKGMAEFVRNLPASDKSVPAGIKTLQERLDPPKTADFDKDPMLKLEDMHWLHERILEHNLVNEDKVYLHEMFEDSQLVLPKNVEIPRNPVLEKRCEELKAQHANRLYKNMTKNVDSVRQHYPEDTISYQVKQLNRQLIAVGQFVVSVAAGFAFGFIGLQYMMGDLDFGFRLLLGIICALVIALAELYFLAKKLNEEIIFEEQAVEQTKKSKID